MKAVSKPDLNTFSAKLKAWIRSRKITASDLDSGSATAGQVPTADGSGGVSWAAAGGGGVLEGHTLTINFVGSNAKFAILGTYNNVYGWHFLDESTGTFTFTDVTYFSGYGGIGYDSITSGSFMKISFGLSSWEMDSYMTEPAICTNLTPQSTLNNTMGALCVLLADTIINMYDPS